MACSFVLFARAVGLFLFHACFIANALFHSSSASKCSPPIAIIAEGEGSEAFTKVVGALCEKENDVEKGRGITSEHNLCRHFEDASEVSSIITRHPQAFDAIVVEVRMV